MPLSEALSGVRNLTNHEGRRTDVLLSWELWLFVLQLLQDLMEQLERRDDAGLIGDYLKGSEECRAQVLSDSESNPWVKFAGMFQDDPMFDEFVEAMAQNRRDVDLMISRNEAEERQSA
jgi:hypothetical protein